MRKVMYLLIVSLFIFMSCTDDNKVDEPEVKKDFFTEPILDWSLSKDGIKSKEKRTLIADRSPDYYTIWGETFESKGSGGLEFSGEVAELKKVEYIFFSNAQTLVQVKCDFVNNSDIATNLREFLIKKYGNLYEEKTSVSDSKQMIWLKTGMIITYSKGEYGHDILYRKNPLK